MAEMSRRARENMVVGQMHHHQDQQQQHRRGYSMSSARREKDEDLALFQDMHKRENTQYLHADLNDAAKSAGFLDPIPPASIQRKGVGADLLNSDADKSDYDWLLTPPGTPLFPSLDLESPAYSALQQGLLINRSLAAIKTSRIASNNRADPPSSKLLRGNPSPSRRPSTPLNGHSNSSASQGTPTSHSVRPSTPTRSSNSAAKYPRPSTPTRQSSSMTSTGRPSIANSNRPSTPTNRPSTPTGRPLTPTLRRSSSSSTSTQPFSTTTRGNPSPTRSTASSVPARGISPVRSQYRGNSPARGTSPAPSIGRASSSPRAHPIIIPDGLPSDIPPNLRTTSDRASSAHRRRPGYSIGGTGQMPDGLDHPSCRPSSPNLIKSCRAINHGQDHLSVQSGRVSSDDESSYEASSQSAMSSRGLTPERGVVYGQRSSAGHEDWRNSCPSLQSKQSPSDRDSPHYGTPSMSHNLEIQRAAAAGGFRPLMTKNSISAFYSTRANSLLRSRPLTPGSTASSEQGASVAPDSEGDEDLSNGWGRLELSLGGRADILVLDTEAAKLTSWDSLQCDGELKLLESRMHSEIHEADSYSGLGPREALVEGSSPYSVSSSGLMELKTRSIHDEKHSECTGGAIESSCFDQEAQKLTNGEWHEQGREQQPGQKQQRQNLQAKEDNALVLEFWGNSESDLHNESNSERQIRPSSLIEGESCDHEDRGGARNERETPNIEKDVGSVPDLKHVKEKLVLLCSPIVVPALQQSLEQHKLKGPGSIVKEALPSFVEHPIHEPHVIPQGSGNKNLAKKEVETGLSMEDAAAKMFVYNHAEHTGMYCNLGSECSTEHVSTAPLEVQSSMNDGSGGREAVKRPMSRQEVQNGLGMARQKNIWYIYRNSEDYGSPSMSGTETELEDQSPGGRLSHRIEKQVQVAASHHMGPTTVITQPIDQQDVDEASNHECQSDNPVKLFAGGLKEIPGESQRELLLLKQEKEESEKGVHQEEESLETACCSHSKSLQKKAGVGLHDSFAAQLPEENKTVLMPEPNKVSGDRCTDLTQLDDSMSDCASILSVQELAAGSAAIRCSDSKVSNLSSPFPSQECCPKIGTTLTGNPKMEEGNLQVVTPTIVTEDGAEQGDGDQSLSSEELEHGIDCGEALLWPVMVKAPSEGTGETAERRMIQEMDESKVRTTSSSRWDRIESPVHSFQDLKQPDHDPPAITAVTPEIVHANQVSDVTRSGKSAEHDQADDANSDPKGWEQRRENEAAPEAKMGEACSQTDEVQDMEYGPIACMDQGFVEIPEAGSCESLWHPISLDVSTWSAVSGTRDNADARMSVENWKQSLCSDASVAQKRLQVIRPLKSEERVSRSDDTVSVTEAMGECVSKLDEVEEVKHVNGQALKPASLVATHVNDNTFNLDMPAGKLDKDSPTVDIVERPVCMGAKASDHARIKLLKEVISCDAQKKQGAEEGNKPVSPHGENNSGMWNLKSSPITKACVSDVSDAPLLPMELHKQGASIRQGGDVVAKPSTGFHQPTFVKYGSMRAGHAEGQSLLKQISSEEHCLDHLVDTVEPKTSTVPQMTENNNMSTLKNSETKKAAAAMLIKTVSKSNSTARKNSKTLASKETLVEVGRLGLPTGDSVTHVDSVQLPDGKKLTLADSALSQVKDEVVENSDSPGPIARKHLSSFKFGRKRPSPAEPEKRGITMNTNSEILKDQHMKQAPLSTKLPGKSHTPGGAKGVGTPNGPQLNKLSSVRAGSPMRAVQSGDSQPAQLAQGSNTNGRMAEELNGQSRFSNITVRPGSVSQHFEWDRSSLEEVSSSRSSSKSTDTATVVSWNITLAKFATDQILFCSTSLVHKLMYEAAELASEEEGHSFSISPDLKLFANAGIPTKPEKHQHGSGKQRVHERKGMSAKAGYWTTIAHMYLPGKGFEEKPGRKFMQSPKAQLMHDSKSGEEALVTVKKNVIMHLAETVRLNFELNSNVNKLNDKCCLYNIVILKIPVSCCRLCTLLSLAVDSGNNPFAHYLLYTISANTILQCVDRVLEFFCIYQLTFQGSVNIHNLDYLILSVYFIYFGSCYARNYLNLCYLTFCC